MNINIINGNEIEKQILLKQKIQKNVDKRCQVEEFFRCKVKLIKERKENYDFTKLTVFK